MLRKRNEKKLIHILELYVFIMITIVHLFSDGALGAKAGLQTKFSMVTLENLQPGTTYNTRELVNLPLIIRNTGEEKTTVKIDVLRPDPPSKLMVEQGYEAVPSTSWVRVSQDEFDIEAGESAGTDVIIAVPDENKHLTKKYQADLHIRSIGTQFINVALKSNLRFTIATRRLTKAELDRRTKIMGYGKKVEFDLLPGKGFIDGLALGQNVDTEKEHSITLKISNPNDIDFTYFLDVQQFNDLELPLLEGYEALPDLRWVNVGKREVSVPANTIKKLKLKIKMPDKAEYRGKSYGFCVKATVSGTPVELNQVSRFYITTKKGGN